MAWNFICVRCQSISDKEFNYCDNCGAMNSAAYFQKNKEEQTPVPCTCPSCLEENKQKEKHINHPFYKKVKENVEKFAMQQILKGAETYPEPFNPDSWTEEELYEHNMQELADAQNYSTGMFDRLIKQRKEIERLNKENENQLHYINSARKDYTQSIETIDELRKEIRQLNEDTMKIESVSDFNADECQRLREENKALEEKYTSKLNEYEFLFEQTGKQQKKIIELNRKALAYDAIEDRINAAYHAGKINGATFEVLMNRKLGEID
jgi:predicted nuclease with TOPRIM domain